jgi:ankyrin repeat protein
VKLLLENGAEVNAEGGEYGNALQAASFGGNEAIVKLLLENGAEVNAEGGNMGMHSRQHHLEAMRQL